MKMSNLSSHHYHSHLKSTKSSKIRKEPPKVTYISNPVRVRANNPSEFRALVQELTGKASNIVSHGDTAGTMITDETSSVLDHAGTQSKISAIGNVVDDCSNTISPLLHLNENLLWRVLSECSSGF